jgi:hypothetical protein
MGARDVRRKHNGEYAPVSASLSNEKLALGPSDSSWSEGPSKLLDCALKFPANKK